VSECNLGAIDNLFFSQLLVNFILLYCFIVKNFLGRFLDMHSGGKVTPSIGSIDSNSFIRYYACKNNMHSKEVF